MKHLFLMTALLLGACSQATQSQSSEALLDLGFEKSLDSRGQLAVQSELQNGKTIKYGKGPAGKSYVSPGTGQSVLYETEYPIKAESALTVSFLIQANDKVNPNAKVSSSQTPISFSGLYRKNGKPTAGRISYSVGGSSDFHLKVNFVDASGEKHELRTVNGSFTPNWHKVTLHIDPEENLTELRLDGQPQGKVEAVSAIATSGITKVKIGTWHKENQAFWGQLDEVKIETAVQQVAQNQSAPKNQDVPALRR